MSKLAAMGTVVEEKSATGSNGSPGKMLQGSTTTPATLVKELDRLHELLAKHTEKTAAEGKRERILDTKIREAEQRLLDLSNETRGLDVIIQDSYKFKKSIAKLEKALQTTKIALSKSRAENVEFRTKISNFRTNKLLFLQIYNDMLKELNECTEKCKLASQEISTVVDGKQKVKMETTNLKHQMMIEMEAFNREIEVVKASVSTSQYAALDNIRSRMNTGVSQVSRTSKTKPSLARKTIHKAGLENKPDVSNVSQVDQSRINAEILLAVKSHGHDSVESFLLNYQQSEEHIFGLYTSIQRASEEMEQLEVENRKLETVVSDAADKVKEIEIQHAKLKVEVENHKSSIDKALHMYQSSYNANKLTLNGIAQYLLNILRNVASDNVALDIQILSTGVSDRSIDELMGVIEQRVDDLIQMQHAVSKQSIHADDFLRISVLPPHIERTPLTLNTVAGSHVVIPSVSELPEEEEDPDDNGKIEPIDIGQLKEYMQKKIQKGLHKKQNNHNNPLLNTATTSYKPAPPNGDHQQHVSFQPSPIDGNSPSHKEKKILI